jgi:putative phage-type endonuclease
MSFGKLSNVVTKTISLLNNEDLTNLNMNNIASLKNKVYNELKKNREFSDLDYNIINQVFDRLFNCKYNYNSNLTFENGKNCFRDVETTNYEEIVVPKKYKALEEHFQKLYKLPQPAQRSKEWFDYRYNRITASDTAAAIDMNPYEPVESFILKKCDPNYPFRDNDTVFHGKKYEPIATMIYEHIYNSRVFEFGALPSEKYNFLGASPDGIASKYTLDNKFSERLGTMLEIKCPVTREITTKGKTMGEICPFYYYCQVQQQLACCELDVCDFWQCKILEYNKDVSNFEAREQYLLDNCSSCENTFSENGTSMTIDNKLKKGLFLEFYPKTFTPEFEGDKIEWKGKYIMPKRLDMSEEEYDKWLVDTMNNWQKEFPNEADNLYFHRVIYWKLVKSHNVEIKRDDAFMESILPILKNTWNRVTFYRKNKDKLPELKTIVDKRTKYLRNMNTTVNIHNSILVNKQLLFLAPSVKISSSDLKDNKVTPKSKITKNNNYKKSKPIINNDTITYHDQRSGGAGYNSDTLDDSNNCDFIDS